MKLDLASVEWGEFKINEIFKVSSTASGIDKNKLNGRSGKYPYITRTDKQNGIDMFIDSQDDYLINDANVITVGLDTQTVFYQNNPFYTGQNIQLLHHASLNRYNALFMINLLRKLMLKFSWGSQGATLTRLKKGKILLPIDSDGNPNWQFMEEYMKAIEQRQIKNILAYYTAKSCPGGG